MKVLVVNASETRNDLLEQAIQWFTDVLTQKDVAYEVIALYKHTVHPCTSCGKCLKKRRCIFDGIVNEIADQSETFDALIVATDVLYGEVNQQCMHFLDCLFRSSSEKYTHKVASVILTSKTRNTKKAYQTINTYFSYAYMPIVTGRYFHTITSLTDEKAKREMLDLGNMVILLMQALQQPPTIQVDKLDEFMLGR